MASPSPSKKSFGSNNSGTATKTTPKTNADNNNNSNNVLLSSAYLMPIRGKMITAHSTRQTVMDWIEETNARKQQKQQKQPPSPQPSPSPPLRQERAMIVDISATTWNWDTYAIVAGTPSPITVRFENLHDLRQHLPLVEKEEENEEDVVVVVVVSEGTLVPQPGGEKVWMPKGAKLKLKSKPKPENTDTTTTTTTNCEGTTTTTPPLPLEEFVFEAPVDPNDDRLEHWEQEVTSSNNPHLYKFRIEMVHDAMKNMLRFYDLDRIVCWDLSWGLWEAVRDNTDTDTTTTTTEECSNNNNNNNVDADGFPKMRLVTPDGTMVSFPTTLDNNDNDNDGAYELLYECARPITPSLLAESLDSVAGYYLVGGNTYTMSLFHNMWDQQQHPQQDDGDDDDKNNDHAIGHMQLLRNKLGEGTLFYMGHSAGLIMSGPNILTATFKGIDAFSVVTQPYNAPFVRLPPSETPDTFFASRKNDLFLARTKMLEKMKQYDAWKGYNVVKALAFPHYDSRPRSASFPQSAETYLRATDAEGRFAQSEASLLVGRIAAGAAGAGVDSDTATDRTEPEDVTNLREATNAQRLPCYPVANGHAVVLECGGREVLRALSPEEEGGGILHWDTYMPYVPDKDYNQFANGRTSYEAGSFSNDPNTVAGDRTTSSSSSSSSEEEGGDSYHGDRIFSRLQALGLPNPNRNAQGEAGRLFRSE